MAIMMARLYEALRLAQIPDDAARQAAEEAASYENRLAKLEGDLATVKWMLGINITLTLLVLGRLFIK
jgi:hypothetical protein